MNISVKKTNNWLLKWGLSFLVLIGIYTLSYLFNPYDYYVLELFKDNKMLFFADLFITFLFSWGIIEASILSAKILEHRIPWTRFPIWRFILQTILVVVSVMLLIYVQTILVAFIYGDQKHTKNVILAWRQFILVSIIISLFVSAVQTGYSLLKNWKNSVMEAAELKVKALEFKEIAMNVELESLKTQLNPHFMFNNFSTLSELVTKDPNTANKFLENLSRVYRYMIQNLKKNMITLKEEITFLNAYFYLLEIRHGENIKLKIDLDEEDLKSSIPPVTLQLLVENAIKHNIATNDQPLLIEIVSIENKYLKISNNLQRIPTPFPSTGIGLKNIKNRYKILFENNLPVIEETDKTFTVILPLLNSKTEDHEDINN